MVVMLACGLSLVLALTAARRWRGCRLELPAWARGDIGLAAALRALGWLVGVGMVSGLLVGLFVVGPAGRLAMRLLGATSPDAHGRLTEAGEVIGEITVNGTLAFITFVGLPFGLAVGLVYAFASFVLPRGMIGGVLLGAALLVVAGSRLDPLREENLDFTILGPGWLAVLAFSVMAVLTGLVIAPVAGRVGAALGSGTVRSTVALAPFVLLLVAVLATSPWALAALLVAAATFVAVLLTAARWEVARRRGRRALQAAIVAVVAIASPGFLGAVGTITG